MASNDGSPKQAAAPGTERTITEYIAGDGVKQTSGLARSLPGLIGGPIYAVAYLLRGVNIFGTTYYTLTNRRVVVRQGVMRKEVRSVPLESIDDIRIANENTFVRTGDLELLKDGKVVSTLVGVQDPWPARQTMLDAVHARVEIQKVLDRQRRVAAVAPSV